MAGLRISSRMIWPVVAWMMRMSRPLISIRMGVRAWVRPTLVAEAEFAVGVDDVAADPGLRLPVRGGWRAGFGSGLIGRGWGAPVQGAVRPAAVVVANEGVAEGLQLRDGGRLLRLGGEPFLQGLLKSLHFAAGGGVVRFGVLLHHAESAEFGLEAVEGVASGVAAGEAGGEDHAVVRQHRGGNALVSDRLTERGDDCGPGHRLVAGDRERVAGVVVDKAQDLHIGTGVCRRFGSAG